MDALFYLLLLVSFSFGVLNLTLLFIAGGRTTDRGVRTLMAPILPLTLITVLETVQYYLRLSPMALSPALFALFYDWGLISIALSWIWLAYRHYELNGVDRFRTGRLVLFGLLGAVVALLFPGRTGFPRIVLRGICIGLLYFAALKGFLILRFRRRLLGSSVTALVIAGISVAVYPAVAAGEIVRWRIPYLDPGLSLWVQVHPVYVALVNIPLSVFLIRISAAPDAERESERLSIDPTLIEELTERERDVLKLLFAGCKNQEIADRLCLSLATVKTHIYHIYQKLNIRRRSQLFAFYEVKDS